MNCLDKDVTMDVSTEEVTILAIFLGWAGTTFGFGRTYGVLNSRMKGAEKEITDLHKSVNKVLNCFVTADGEPRLVSFAALDKVREPCREENDRRFKAHEKCIEKHDEKLDEILAGIATLNAKKDRRRFSDESRADMEVNGDRGTENQKA